MDARPGTILRHAAGCFVCSLLVFGIVYAAVLVRFTSEYERQGGTTGLLSTTSQYMLQVFMFLPGLLGSNRCFGDHTKDFWSWVNILLDGCVLYSLWTAIRSWRRKRHGDDIQAGP